MASLAIAHRGGVSIATGTDFGGGSTRANQLAWEVEQLVEAGLEPWEALGCATWRGGELLGEPDAGVIREGGPADFALVHGDPTSDPTALWRVWHVAGRADRVPLPPRPPASPIVIRPSRLRSFVAPVRRRATVGSRHAVPHYLVIGRRCGGPPDRTERRCQRCSHRPSTFDADAVGVFPALLLVLVALLTALGVVANVAFG